MHFCAFLFVYLKKLSTRHADMSTGSLNLKPKPFLQFERLLNDLQVLGVHNTPNQQTQGKNTDLCYTTLLLCNIPILCSKHIFPGLCCCAPNIHLQPFSIVFYF